MSALKSPVQYFGAKQQIAEQLVALMPPHVSAFDDALLYVDPPYVHSSRRGARYSHEMTDADHRDLAEALHACRAAVMLSGYESGLYDELFGDWHQVRIGARSDNALDRDVAEIVWSNRPLGDFLWHEVPS